VVVGHLPEAVLQSCAGSCERRMHNASMLAGAGPLPATMRWAFGDRLKLADALPYRLPPTGSTPKQIAQRLEHQSRGRRIGQFRPWRSGVDGHARTDRRSRRQSLARNAWGLGESNETEGLRACADHGRASSKRREILGLEGDRPSSSMPCGRLKREFPRRCEG